MTELPPRWRVHTTQQFESDYAALCEAGGCLPEIWKGWLWYLERNPPLMSTGVTGTDDDNCRVMTSSDAQLGFEYVLGLSLNRGERRVFVMWIESYEFEPDFS